MGTEVHRKGDRYRLWSTYTDSYATEPMTRRQMTTYLVREATREFHARIGRLFDHRTADTILETLSTMEDRGVRLGLAGGLGPDCGGALNDLRTGLLGHGGDEDVDLDVLSYDAESRVRVPVPDPIEGEEYQDMLDRTSSVNYVAAVCAALR